ncbi:SCO family protein [Halomonas sp. LS-001]
MSQRFSRRFTLLISSGVFVLILVAVGAFGLNHYVFNPNASAQQENNGLTGGPIELPSTRGDFSLTQLEQDQVAVVSFGYTYCPDVCPMNQAIKKQALAELTEEQRARVVPLMISVDPERDSLERLKEYMGFFGDSFVGATGSQQQLEALAERYGVIWRRVDAESSAMEYTIDHSSSLYVVDRDGRILERVLYAPNAAPLVSALKATLGS